MNETDEDFPWFWVVSAASGFLLLLIVVLQIGSQTEQNRMRREAIDRGFAEYDSCTGEWKWKEPVKE